MQTVCVSMLLPWIALHHVQLCWWSTGRGLSVKVSALPNHFPSAATTCWWCSLLLPVSQTHTHTTKVHSHTLNLGGIIRVPSWYQAFGLPKVTAINNRHAQKHTLVGADGCACLGLHQISLSVSADSKWHRTSFLRVKLSKINLHASP